MIIPKLVYFTLNMSVYSTHTFSFKYFQDNLSLQVWHVGWIASVASVQLLGALFWGSLADKTKRYGLLLTLGTIAYVVSFCGLRAPIDKDEWSVAARIAWGAGWYGTSVFASSAMFPLVDASILESIEEEKFGQQRVFGTLGHATAILISGLTIDRFGYIGMFANLLISSFIFIITIIVHFSKPAKADASAKSAKTVTEQVNEMEEPLEGNALSSPIVALLSTPAFMFFMLFVLSEGLLRSTLSIFLPLFMQNEMGRSAGLVAAVTVVRMTSEAVIFLIFPILGKYCGGPHGLLIISQIAGILRTLAYAVIPTHGHWFFASFAIEILKGISTGCLVAGGVVLAKRLAPKECQRSAQAAFSGVYTGLSGTVAGLLGGTLLLILPGHSMQTMFIINAGTATLALIFFLIKYIVIDGVLMQSCFGKK